MILGQIVYYAIACILLANIFVIVYLVLRNRKGFTLFVPKTDNDKGILNGFKYLEKIEKLIIKSNLKKFIPWINGNLIVIASILFGVLGFGLSYKYFSNAVISLVFAIVLFMIPNFILEGFASYNSVRIERSFLYFLNVLCNFAQLKDDVYFTFEKTIGYIDEPLNSYLKVFIEEVKRGLPIETALDGFKEKFDNNRFKLFIKNTQLCVKHGGSFLKLAKNNLELVKQLQIEKARRKNETALGKTLIYVMMVFNIGLAVYMFSIYPETIQRVKTEFYGQVVVLVNAVNLFITFYLSLKLEKMDY